MESKIHIKDFVCYKSADEKQRQRAGRDPCFNLDDLPSETMKEEWYVFIMGRIDKYALSTIVHEKTFFHQICRFLNTKAGCTESMLEKSPDKWLRLFKGWILEEGLQLTKKSKGVYGTESIYQASLISYLQWMVESIQPEDTRDEVEKDIWELEQLDIPIQMNLIKNRKTLNFTKICQPDIRNEVKKAVYLNLQCEAIACVTREIGAMRRLSEFLKRKYPQIESCGELDRMIFEEYLICLKTEDTSTKHLHSELTRLRAILETIGKLYGFPQLETLVLSRDIPPTPKAEFRTYSDAELKRLNAAIVKMSEQIARLMIIHQMLGTRISDTLTLQTDCLSESDGVCTIKIRQMKTHMYEKPVSAELAILIRQAMRYTKERYGETKYIFVREKDPEKPMQYNTVQEKVVRMIHTEDLRDDNGHLFGFGTHMYRHYYGVKLTEMHLDDWTIARLLGHNNINNVRYYRKMSNQILADETRRIRHRLSEIILENLDGWGEEYEQIRQDDSLE